MIVCHLPYGVLANVSPVINVHLVDSRETTEKVDRRTEQQPPPTEPVMLCFTLFMVNLYGTTPTTLSNISPLI